MQQGIPDIVYNKTLPTTNRIKDIQHITFENGFWYNKYRKALKAISSHWNIFYLESAIDIFNCRLVGIFMSGFLPKII